MTRCHLGCVLGLLAFSGCHRAAQTDPSDPDDAARASGPSGPVHEMSDNWGSGLGCTPAGPRMQLEGRLRVRPFGKGTNGAVIETADGDWIVSYRAEGVLLDLEDERVVVEGRPCDKQGEAIFGPHFDLLTIAKV